MMSLNLAGMFGIQSWDIPASISERKCAIPIGAGELSVPIVALEDQQPLE